MVAFLLDGSAGYPGNAYTYIGLQLFTIFLNIMVGDLSTINLSLCMWVKQYQQTGGACQSASACYQLLWVGFCVFLIHLRLEW